MADRKAQTAFGQLPAEVQEELRTMKGKLGPDLKLGGCRAIDGGWAASIYILDGHEGGDFVIICEPGMSQDGKE